MNKSIVANTFTPMYDEIEDRLRLSINYQDVKSRIDFMITRNFVIKLLPALEEYIYKYYPDAHDTTEKIHTPNTTQTPKEANAELIKKTENLSATDGNDFNLYKSEEDLLVKIDFQFDKKTKRTKLIFVSKNEHTAVSIVEAKLLQQIMYTIKSSIPSFSWGISSSF